MQDSIRRSVFAMALVAACLNVHADEAERNLRLVLTGGLTFGGDDIFDLKYDNGDSADVTAGGLFEVGAGVLWQSPNYPVQAQLTVNYHTDLSAAENGDASFDRYPIETTLFYTEVPHWRFGAGVRWVMNPHAETDIENVENVEVEFKDTTGFLAEVGYQVGNQAWISLRGVLEEYEVESIKIEGYGSVKPESEKVSGNHIGLNFLVAF